MLGVAAACILIGVWKPALPATVFYRVTFSDTKVKQDSIDSRLRQYDRYLNLISEKPSALIWGAGPAGLHRALHGDLHNSYLRAWAVGGILGFGAFLYLCGNCLRDFLLSIRRSRGSELHHVVSIYFLAAFLGWSCQAATVPADTSCIQWFFFMLAYLLRRSTCTLPTGPVPRPQGLVRPCMFPRWRVCAARP
jgi:O-antigen ligase